MVEDLSKHTNILFIKETITANKTTTPHDILDGYDSKYAKVHCRANFTEAGSPNK